MPCDLQNYSGIAIYETLCLKKKLLEYYEIKMTARRRSPDEPLQGSNIKYMLIIFYVLAADSCLVADRK